MGRKNCMNKAAEPTPVAVRVQRFTSTGTTRTDIDGGSTGGWDDPL